MSSSNSIFILVISACLLNLRSFKKPFGRNRQETKEIGQNEDGHHFETVIWDSLLFNTKSNKFELFQIDIII